MKKGGQAVSEERRLTILRRLVQCGTMSMLEIGFSASPQALRNLAASGLIVVTAAITPRGHAVFEALNLKAQRRTHREKMGISKPGPKPKIAAVA